MHSFLIVYCLFLALSQSEVATRPDDLPATTMPSATAPEGLAPGVRLRVYQTGERMERLLELAADQTPNVELVSPKLDFANATFGGPTVQFRATVEATLVAPAAGQYDFRLRSDDGALLLIDDTPIVIHDGTHEFTA